MKLGQGKTPPPHNGANGVESWNEEENAELLGLARQHFSTAFPNPKRSGCPPRARLLTQARSGALPDEELRAHLFNCSECFEEYRAAKTAPHAQTAGPARWWRLRAGKISPPGFNWSWVTAGALVLSAAAFLGWYAQRAARPPQQDSGVAQSVTAPPPRPAQTTAPVAAPTAPPAEIQPATVAKSALPLAIDLNRYVALRAPDAASGKQVVQLPRARLRLELTLAEGSLAGAYTLRLANSAGRELRSVPARSRDGKRLSVACDLTGLAPGNYQLRLRHASGEQEVYPVNLNESAKPLR